MSREWFEGANWCPKCQRWLERKVFRPNPNLRGGLDSWCRACHAARSAQWRAENPDVVEGYNRRRREEYAAARGPLERECANPECGRRFAARRADQRACSRVCRSRLAQIARTERDRARRGSV